MIIRSRDVKFNVYYVVYILYINILLIIVKKSNKIEIISMNFLMLIWKKINQNLGKVINRICDVCDMTDQIRVQTNKYGLKEV